DAETPQRHVGGHGRDRVGREVFRQRVAQPHVHGALDLALAQLRVDGPADVVGGEDTLDLARRPIDDDELRGVPEGGVDGGVLDARLAEVVGPVDAVLALVVDADLAAAGARRVAGRLHGAGAHQRASGTGGLARAQLARRIDDDAHPARIELQLLHRHLQGHRVPALAHLRPAVAHFDGAIDLEAHDGASDLLEPVAEPGVLEPEPEADGLAGGASGLIVGPYYLEAARGAEAAVVHDLTGAPF